MWIAKNSITGTCYGKKYNSVYDCQAFIDKELCVLEYEMQRCFSLEEDVILHLKNENKSFFDIINDALKSFGEDSGLKEDLSVIVDFSLQGKSQKEIDIKLHELACSRWQKNNIIRCYNLSQNRFADGFDF